MTAEAEMTLSMRHLYIKGLVTVVVFALLGRGVAWGQSDSATFKVKFSELSEFTINNEKDQKNIVEVLAGKAIGLLQILDIPPHVDTLSFSFGGGDDNNVETAVVNATVTIDITKVITELKQKSEHVLSLSFKDGRYVFGATPKRNQKNVKVQDSLNGPSTLKVEPRRYIEIWEERNDLRNTKKDTDKEKKRKDVLLWELSQDENGKWIPDQKHELIDPSAILRVEFKYPELYNDIHFRGNLSLVAYADGTQIAVSPYSLVGIEQKGFGTTAKSPSELAMHLILLNIEARRLRSMYGSFRRQLNDMLVENKATSPIRSSVNRAKKHLEKFGNDSQTVSMTDYYHLREELQFIGQSTGNRVIQMFVDQHKDPDEWKGDLLAELTAVSGDDNGISPLAQDESLRDYLSTLHTVHSYLSYFKASGDKTLSVFLELSGITRTDFDRAMREFDYHLPSIRQSVETNAGFSWAKMMDQEVTVRRKQSLELMSINLALERFSYAGGEVKNQLDKHEYDHNFLLKGKAIEWLHMNQIKQVEYRKSNSKFNASKIDLESVKSKEAAETEFEGTLHRYIKDSTDVSLLRNTEVLRKMADALALKAAMHIYQDLVYATIDLEKEGLTEVRRLEVSVVWYNKNGDGSDATVADGTALATARFRIRGTGWDWRPQLTESAMLIKRINEDLLSDTYPLSPSNFKPTAGASIMWGYRSDKRGNGCTRFWKWLEPSFGLNVSYLDFDTGKDFEIGAGPVIGLWNNKVFFTGGYNFMASAQSPFYWGIGFSFSKTATWIKEATEK